MVELEVHHATDAQERADLAAMCVYWATLREPFSRRQWPAHFTGSAVVVDPSGERVCLVHHRKLNRWLQPGGHCEPADLRQLQRTALREAAEETGLSVSVHARASGALDVDAHRIPARADEPAHTHLDVRFLLVASAPEQLAHDPAEAHGARWLRWQEALKTADEPAFRRMLTKAQRLVSPGA